MTEADVDYLYRYCSLDGPSLTWAARIFTHDEIYFPNPREFNDPFDCLPEISLEANPRMLKAYFSELSKRYEPEKSRGSRRRMLRNAVPQLAGGNKNSELSKHIVGALRRLEESVGVLCLSEDYANVLMWSHYADKHKGICLRFQASKETAFFGRAQKVKYQIERPTARPFLDGKWEYIEKTLLTKASWWNYEKEWRVIEHERGPNTYKFPPYCLDGVIFGARISEKNRDYILSLIGQRDRDIEVSQASISGSRFEIDVRAI